MGNLTIIIEQLIYQLIKLKELYDKGNEPKKDKAFFQFVKKETEPIFNLLDEWEVLALAFIKEKKLSLHEQQVLATKENIKALLLHSYYVDVRERKYMEIYKSSDYILSQMLKEIEQWNRN